MQEVRVESLDGLEVRGRELRLSANAGRLSIVFPRAVWDHILMSAEASKEPDAAELKELRDLRSRLKAHAEEQAFETILEGVQVSGPGLEYGLVLRPGGLFAVTTGYLFAPVVGPELMAKIGAGLAGDTLVEQAYAIGAVASEEALATDDDNLKTLSMRGRRCSTSRFEMAPELWQVLSEGLGWENVETFVNERRV
jgi:alkylation response protein AidB-like acyl-CoA dehydrogenase